MMAFFIDRLQTLINNTPATNLTCLFLQYV